MGHSPVSLLGARPCAGPHVGLLRGQHLAHRLRAGALSSRVKDVHPQPPHGLCPPENQETAHSLLQPDVSASSRAGHPPQCPALAHPLCQATQSPWGEQMAQLRPLPTQGRAQSRAQSAEGSQCLPMYRGPGMPPTPTLGLQFAQP